MNSHVRVNRSQIYEIYKQFDQNGDECISYYEYGRALRKNPDLLDWFELLNSAKSKQTAEVDESLIMEAALKQVQQQEEEKNKDVVKIDHEKIEKIVKLKTMHEKKDTKVKELE